MYRTSSVRKPPPGLNASAGQPLRLYPNHPIFPWALNGGVQAGTGTTGTTYDELLTSLGFVGPTARRHILSDISRNSPIHSLQADVLHSSLSQWRPAIMHVHSTLGKQRLEAYNMAESTCIRRVSCLVSITASRY